MFMPMLLIVHWKITLSACAIFVVWDIDQLWTTLKKERQEDREYAEYKEIMKDIEG